jgi:uncharacterized GH25 family protein
MRWLPFTPKASRIKKVGEKDVNVTRISLKLSLLSVVASGLMLGLVPWSGLGHAQSLNTFSGTFTDQDGNPLSGITVTIQNPTDGNAASGVTDANGNFSFTAVADDYTYC